MLTEPQHQARERVAAFVQARIEERGERPAIIDSIPTERGEAELLLDDLRTLLAAVEADTTPHGTCPCCEARVPMRRQGAGLVTMRHKPSPTGWYGTSGEAAYWCAGSRQPSL